MVRFIRFLKQRAAVKTIAISALMVADCVFCLLIGDVLGAIKTVFFIALFAYLNRH